MQMVSVAAAELDELLVVSGFSLIYASDSGIHIETIHVVK